MISLKFNTFLRTQD